MRRSVCSVGARRLALRQGGITAKGTRNLKSAAMKSTTPALDAHRDRLPCWIGTPCAMTIAACLLPS
jgi:hypothetical protein